MSKYHHLIERDTQSNTWHPLFGDYERKVVTQERQDVHEGHLGPRLKDLRVVTTSASDEVGHYVAIKERCRALSPGA